MGLMRQNKYHPGKPGTLGKWHGVNEGEFVEWGKKTSEIYLYF